MVDKNHEKKDTSAPLGLPPALQSFSDFTTEKGELDPATLVSDRQTSETLEKFPVGTIPAIEGYGIVRKLGQGGMGTVFLATDEKLMRKVAIKIVSQNFRENTELLDRFESEIQTLAALQHPHIAQLYSAGTCNDLPYFSMEYVEGETLEAYAEKPMKAVRVVEIVSQLCDAVDYCHDKGVLHRDLKPANVLLDAKQQPKIADFGLAKAVGHDSSSTRTGEILGTPGYMAPEQASGVVKSFTAACDVYALGAILYRLLTGRPPFAAAEPLQAIMQVLSDDPIQPRKLVSNVPLDLQTICLKCLEKKASKRYQSANELRTDLNCFLEGKPISARPANAVEKSIKWIKRNPVKALLCSVAGLLAVAVLLGLSWHNSLLANELAKTRRLADHGAELSNWLVDDHLQSLSEIGGTTQTRHQVAARVREYLDNSYGDIPPDARYTRNLGHSYARLAAISGGVDQNNLGDQEQAIEFYLRSLELYDIASEQDPDDTKVKMLRASSLLALSDTYLEAQNPTESERYFELAKESLKSWESNDWETQFLEIQILGREALMLTANNDFESALNVWDKIERQLNDARDIANPLEFQHQQIYLSNRRGDCLANMGRTAESRAALLKSVELSEAAAKQEPQNVLCQRRWSSCLERFGNSLSEQGKIAESLEQYIQSQDILERIVEADPSSVEAAMSLASICTNIGDTYLYLQDLPAATKTIDRAIQIYQSLAEQQKLGLTGKRLLAISLQSRANCLVLAGKLKAAADAYEEHHSFCLGLITTDRESIPELTQLAENHFQRSLMLISAWMESGVDPETARQSQEYKEIQKTLDECDAYFERIETTGDLAPNSQAIRNRIEAVRNLVEETIEKLESAEENNNTEVF